MTKRSLSIGKIRGLQATSSPEGIFTILAFDHRQSFAKLISSVEQEAVQYGTIAAAKMQVVKSLAPHASAVLLDPVYGASQSIASGALPGQTGLMVSLDETGYSGDSTARVTEILPEWGLAKIKRMGADAVKLLLYYHPNAGQYTERQEQLTLDVIEECKQLDIAFFLEPVTYSIDPDNDKNSSDFAKERPTIIADTASRLGALGPDVLKLEFPVDANHSMDQDQWFKACQEVSKSSPCPWALLSASVGYELFARQVEVACQAGASGFIAGRALWKEGIPMPEDQRRFWLEDDAAARYDRLVKIAERDAVPWQGFFQPLDVNDLEDWYKSYG